jgi:hypothetical protein
VTNCPLIATNCTKMWQGHFVSPSKQLICVRSSDCIPFCCHYHSWTELSSHCHSSITFTTLAFVWTFCRLQNHKGGKIWRWDQSLQSSLLMRTKLFIVAPRSKALKSKELVMLKCILVSHLTFQICTFQDSKFVFVCNLLLAWGNTHAWMQPFVF